MQTTKRRDEAVTTDDLKALLASHPSTARHPRLHDQFAANLQAAGARNIAGMVIMPDASRALSWLEEQANFKQAMAAANRQVRLNTSPAAPSTDKTQTLGPSDAVVARRQRQAALTENLEKANALFFAQHRKESDSVV